MRDIRRKVLHRRFRPEIPALEIELHFDGRQSRFGLPNAAGLECAQRCAAKQREGYKLVAAEGGPKPGESAKVIAIR